MRRWLTWFVLVGGAIFTMASAESQSRERCCFTHPSYSGTCEVVPGEGETCQSILEYLNNPMAKGKTYCGGTDLRGGWQLVSCEES